jgi:hypothetical protein
MSLNFYTHTYIIILGGHNSIIFLALASHGASSQLILNAYSVGLYLFVTNVPSQVQMFGSAFIQPIRNSRSRTHSVICRFFNFPYRIRHLSTQTTTLLKARIFHYHLAHHNSPCAAYIRAHRALQPNSITHLPFFCPWPAVCGSSIKTLFTYTTQ